MIKDKANPIKLGGLTMQKYHGHARLELRDVKTGKVEVEEHDNTFLASNIEKFLVGGGVANNYPASEMSYTNLLGGVFLFDTAIEDDGEGNYPLFKPKGVKMTANGSYGVGNNSDVTELGSYNAQESQFSSDALVFVYDWTTSQGNGAINSVCLTSQKGGLCGWGNYASKKAHSATNRLTDGQNDSALVGGGSNNFIMVGNGEKIAYAEWGYSKSGTVTFTKKDLNIHNCNFFRDANETFNLVLPTTLYYIGSKGTTVYFCTRNSISNGQSATVYKADLFASTPTVTSVYSVTNSTGKALESIMACGDRFLVCKESDIKTSAWIYDANSQSWSNETMYFGTTTNTITEVVDGVYYGCPTISMADGIIFDEELGIAPCNSTLGNAFRNLSMWDDTAILFDAGSSSDSIYRKRFPLYLATVFNLDSPIVKTADKTMKLTYTITKQVEE